MSLYDKTEKPTTSCTGYIETRRRLLLPIARRDLQLCITGLANSGKTELFNAFTNSSAPVSPKRHTTPDVMARRTNLRDDQFEWLAKRYPHATLRPPSVTFVKTPALLEQFDKPFWDRNVTEALTDCDIIFLTMHAYFSHSSFRILDDITRTHDRTMLERLLKNDSLREDRDVLETINAKVSGYLRSGLGSVNTDTRIRYHEFDKRELALLERFRFLTSKPVVYVVNMDKEEFGNPSASESFLRVQDHIAYVDKDGIVLPFVGRILHADANASQVDLGNLNGASTILQRTLDDYQITRFYTAAPAEVAAWMVKQGTTLGKAITVVNASLNPNVKTVEIANIRELIEIGSVEKALAVGLFRRRPFDHPIEDGDVLLQTSAVLHNETTEENTDSTTTSASSLRSPDLSVPTGEEGRYSGSWVLTASFALNILQFAMLVSTCALLYNPKLRGGVRSFAAALFRRRGPTQEPLLGAAKFEADAESVNFQ